MNYSPEPTIKPQPGFNATEDANNLRAAMKGFGTDEQAIIDILTARNNEQRQAILKCFLEEYGRDLIKDLKSELGGKFEDVIVALMLPPVEYLCKQLRKAMDGIGTEEHALIEILCPMSNEQVKALVPCYEDMYGRPLAEQLCGETSGHFRRLLTLIVTGVRDPEGTVDAEKAVEQAQRLFDAGEAKFGTDEEVFYRIIAHASFSQLRLMFEEYKKISGNTIEQALKHELSGEMFDAMSAIVECCQSPPAFFAKRLFKAMDGVGTDDTTLIRIVVSRSEIDLGNIKKEFERLYDRTLLSAVKAEPTVVPFSGFNAIEDASILRSAMKGFGTDEDSIISVLSTRSNHQRQAIAKAFAKEFGRNLIEDLKSELGGNFEDVIIALMLPTDQYLCKQLNKAMNGLGTEEQTLIEILCPMSNEEIKTLVPCYEEMFNRPLAEHLCSETSGHFRRLLTLILTGCRDPIGTKNVEKAKEQAEQLHAAGEGKFGTDEEVFNKILAHSSFAQLRLVFDEYKNISGMTIEQALKHELSGEMYEAMSAIVECVQSPAAFFANRLHRAMNGAGTDDKSLIRIVVSRSEIDLATIKAEFERIFDRTLLSAVKNETSGDYSRILCALIN